MSENAPALGTQGGIFESTGGVLPARERRSGQARVDKAEVTKQLPKFVLVVPREGDSRGTLGGAWDDALVFQICSEAQDSGESRGRRAMGLSGGHRSAAQGDEEMIRIVAELSESHDAEIREYEKSHGKGSWARRTFDLPKLPEGEMMELIERKLAEYSELEAGWDGYSASPASMKSLRDARRFIELRPQGIQLPYPQIDTNGDVCFMWRFGGVHADSILEGDGTFYYFARFTGADGSEEEHMDENLRVESGWPRGLVKVLRRGA